MTRTFIIKTVNEMIKEALNYEDFMDMFMELENACDKTNYCVFFDLNIENADILCIYNVKSDKTLRIDLTAKLENLD